MKPYFHYLDSLRGLAALSIVFLHFSTFLFPGVGDLILEQTFLVKKSYLLVDLFFVLSGFVLAYNYDFNLINYKEYKNFLLKRLIRIYPLHFVTLIMMVILFWGVTPFLGLSILDEFSLVNNKVNLLLNAFLLHSSGLLSQGCYNCTSWNYPSWSISVEFLSYLMLPFGLIFLKKHNKSYLLLITILLATLFYLNNEIGHLDLASWQGLLRCMAGMSLGCYFANLQLHTKKVSSFFPLAILFFVIITMHLGVYDFIVIILIYAFFALVLMSRSKLFLNNNLLNYLGKISYSVYMTHAMVHISMSLFLRATYKKSLESIPIIHQFILLFVAIMFTIIISSISYRYIEQKLSKFLVRHI